LSLFAFRHINKYGNCSQTALLRRQKALQLLQLLQIVSQFST